MATRYSAIAESIGKVLRESAEAVGVYSNPSGRGDGRECLIRDLLRERVGTQFGVEKAEIIDSLGASSAEMDIAVFDQSVASCLHVMGQRRIVRVESVALTVEVKSRLDRPAFDTSIKAIEGLEKLQRLYRPSELTRVLKPLNDDLPDASHQAFTSGLSPTEVLSCNAPRATLVPQVLNGVFAYQGPSIDAAVGWMGDSPLLDFVCVHGAYVIAREAAFFDWKEGTLDVVRVQGGQSMPALLSLLEQGLQNFRNSRSWVYPDFSRYYEAVLPTLS